MSDDDHTYVTRCLKEYLVETIEYPENFTPNDVENVYIVSLLNVSGSDTYTVFSGTWASLSERQLEMLNNASSEYTDSMADEHWLLYADEMLAYSIESVENTLGASLITGRFMVVRSDHASDAMITCEGGHNSNELMCPRFTIIM